MPNQYKSERELGILSRHTNSQPQYSAQLRRIKGEDRSMLEKWNERQGYRRAPEAIL